MFNTNQLHGSVEYYVTVNCIFVDFVVYILADLLNHNINNSEDLLCAGTTR